MQRGPPISRKRNFLVKIPLVLLLLVAIMYIFFVSRKINPGIHHHLNAMEKKKNSVDDKIKNKQKPASSSRRISSRHNHVDKEENEDRQESHHQHRLASNHNNNNPLRRHEMKKRLQEIAVEIIKHEKYGQQEEQKGTEEQKKGGEIELDYRQARRAQNNALAFHTEKYLLEQEFDRLKRELNIDEKKSVEEVAVESEELTEGKTGEDVPSVLRIISHQQQKRKNYVVNNFHDKGGEGIEIPPSENEMNAARAESSLLTDVNLGLHAFYYPWYGNPETDGRWVHWNHPYMPHWDATVTARYPKTKHQPPEDIGSTFYPELGAYSSSSEETMKLHMEQLVRAKVGVIAISWYPPEKSDGNGIPSDRLVLPIMDAAAQHNIKVCFHSEPYDGRTQETLRRDIAHIYEKYGNHPALLRLGADKRTVMYVYDPYHVPVEQWQRLFSPSSSETIRGTNLDIIAIALFLSQKDMSYVTEAHFDGLYTYFASRRFTFGSEWTHWRGIAEECAKHGKYFIPSVGPGYDDRQVRPWNEENVQPREDGQYYNESFRTAIELFDVYYSNFLQKHGDDENAAAAANSKKSAEDNGQQPPVMPFTISITSFNEWHEGTQIEASVPKVLPGGGSKYHRQAGGGYDNYGPHRSSDYYLQLTRFWSEKMPESEVPEM